MPRPTAPPIAKTPLDKFAYAHGRMVALETAATNAAAAVAAALAGGINAASRLAAWQAAYDAAIAAGATDFEANVMAAAAVLGYISRHKMDPTHAQSYAAMAALAALGGAVSTKDNPCSLGPDNAEITAMLIGAVDLAGAAAALQDLIDAGGY
jgi:hypothetical protein